MVVVPANTHAWRCGVIATAHHGFTTRGQICAITRCKWQHQKRSTSFYPLLLTLFSVITKILKRTCGQNHQQKQPTIGFPRWSGNPACCFSWRRAQEVLKRGCYHHIERYPGRFFFDTYRQHTRRNTAHQTTRHRNPEQYSRNLAATVTGRYKPADA